MSKASYTSKLPAQDRKRAQINALILIGLIVALLLLGVFSIYFYTHRGWITLDNSVSALAADGQGRIWVVDTNGRVWVAEGTQLLPPAGESIQISLSGNDKVTSLAIDKQGQLWVGTARGNVILYNANKEWIIYTPELSAEKYEVREMAVDGLNRVWVKNNMAGLGMIDPHKNDATYAFQYSPATGYRISAFTIDSQGQVWIINNGEVIGKREVNVLGPGDVWKSFGIISAKDYYTEGDLALDRFGQVWMGAYLKDEIGILDPDGGLSTYAVDTDPIRYASPRFLGFDSQDRLWGIDLGLFMLDADGKVSLYPRKLSGFPDGGITTLAMDGQERIWILSYPDLLTVFDVGKSLPTKSPQTIRFVSIIALVVIPSLAWCLAWALARMQKVAINLGKIRDFYIGLVGWFGVYTLVAVGISKFALLGGPGAGGLALLCLSIISLPSIVGLILLYRKRRWMAFGALSAILVNTLGILLVFSSQHFSSPIPFIVGMTPFFLVLE